MLRSIGSRAVATGVLAILASAGWGSGTGCAGSKATELVPGALTQVSVPKDLAGIRVDVLIGGVKVFCENYTADNGEVTFPATLGITGASGDGPVTVEVAAYNRAAVGEQSDAGVSGTLDFTNCEAPISGVGDTSVMGPPSAIRSSVQTFVNGYTLFLPLPLSYSCWGVSSCGNDNTQTCKANQCATAQLDSSKLPDFDPSLIDGTQDCFDSTACFNPTTTVSAQVVDASKCLWRVPMGETGGSGLNVRVVYQDFRMPASPGTGAPPVVVPTDETEILNEETASTLAEGYAVPDPSDPQQFQLAGTATTGLCGMANAYLNPSIISGAGNALVHTIGDVQVSTTCPSKTLYLPICAAQQSEVAQTADGGTTTTVACGEPLPLEPSASVVDLIMDDSAVMDGAFGPRGYATAMGLSLDQPVFRRTYVAFQLTDDSPSGCDPSRYAPGADGGIATFMPAPLAQPGIAQTLGALSLDSGMGGPMLDTAHENNLHVTPALAMGGAYDYLEKFTQGLGTGAVNHAAVMIFTNREPVPPTSILSDAGQEVGEGGVENGGVFSGEECPTSPACADSSCYATTLAAEIAAAAALPLPLDTYFVVLGNDPTEPTPLSYYQGIAGAQVVDATQPMSMASEALQQFADVAVKFGTCVYDLPPGVDTSATLRLTVETKTMGNQVAPAALTVQRDASCNAASTSANGWNIDQGRVRLCGKPCTTVQEAIEATALANAIGPDGGLRDAGAPPDVQVAVTMACTDGGS